MLARTGWKQHASTIPDLSANWSPVPFLYCTKTIRRGYVTNSEQGHRAPDRTARYRSSHLGRPTRHRKANHRGAGLDDKAQSVSRTRPRQPRVIDVPFERPAIPRTDPYAELELAGSTITPNERKAFEGLFNLGRQHTGDGQDENDQTGSRGLDALLGPQEFGMSANGRPRAALSPALRELAKRAQTRKQESSADRSSQNETSPSPARRVIRLSEAASNELKSVSKAMDAAETDAEVWQILQDRVLNRVAALNLAESNPSSTSNVQRRQRNSIDGAAGGQAVAEQSVAVLQKQRSLDLELLRQTLPEHLVKFLSHLSHHYLGSALPLAITASLKTLGPSAVALGATTRLHNLHMRLSYERYADLVAVVDNLNEMERQGYKFDGATLALLDDVLADARRASAGEYGPGMKMVWEMGRTHKARGEIAQWRRIIVERLEEEALTAAREKETARG